MELFCWSLAFYLDLHDQLYSHCNALYEQNMSLCVTARLTGTTAQGGILGMLGDGMGSSWWWW